MKKTSTLSVLGLTITGLLFAGAQPLSAAPLYSENFDKDPGYIGAKGPNDNNISSLSYGVKNVGPKSSKTPDVKVGEYGGTSQYLKDTATLSSTEKGTLTLGSDKGVYDKARNRTTMTFVDTSKGKAGQYTVSFDVSDFKIIDDQTLLYFHLFEGHGANKGAVEFRVTYQTLLPLKAPTAPEIKGIKDGTATALSVDNAITKDGKFTLDFSLESAGQPGDFLALAWSQVKQQGKGAMPSMTIDNIDVSVKEAAQG